MAALTITATQVLPDLNGDIRRGTAGETITAGQAVYFDGSVYRPADANASAVTAAAIGLALNGASVNQAISVQYTGQPTLGAGAAPAVGTVYVAGATAGSIHPTADLATGWFTNVLGIGFTGNKLNMPSGGPFFGGVAVP